MSALATTTRRRSSSVMTVVVALFASLLMLAPGAGAAVRTFTGLDVSGTGQGYGMVATSGEVYAYGNAAYRGNPAGFSGPIVDVSYTGDGQGYAAISSTGQVYAYGTVVWRGNPTGSTPIVGISVTADGQGYAAISDTGQVYAYGTVVSRGNPTGFTYPMVGISVTGNGQGYIAMSSKGQTYAYGTVVSRGNPTGFTGSMVGISVTADGQGYAAVSSIGQVYAYGTVVSRGNPSGFTDGTVAISVTADGQGYAVLSGFGQVYAYGTVKYLGNGDPGSTSISQVRSRIVSIAKSEEGNSAHNREAAGNNCNWYTGTYSSPTRGGTCTNGWRYEAWCADYAGWVWKNSGVSGAGSLSAAAYSFKTYGEARGTWHGGSALTGIQVGDAIVYGISDTSAQHVNIVTAISGSTIFVTGGNQTISGSRDGVSTFYFTKGAPSVGTLAISGYASPVA